MFKNGIIFFGLMVATSAAGFAISFSHDAFTNQQRLSAVSSPHEVISASDQFHSEKPADLPIASDIVAEPVRSMAPAHVNTTPTPTTEVTASVELPSRGTTAPNALAVVSSQDQSEVPAVATMRPRMRNEEADMIASLPVTAAPDRVVRIEPAPLAMNLPVYSYTPGHTRSVVTTTKTKIAPAPRYLIGVYR